MDPAKEPQYEFKYQQCVMCRARHNGCEGGCPAYCVKTVSPGRCIMDLWEELQVLKFHGIINESQKNINPS
jgi:formate hydrogenlyase subunit 6/NADH:ubiquinone oxidoreductase subunit I